MAAAFTRPNAAFFLIEKVFVDISNAFAFDRCHCTFQRSECAVIMMNRQNMGGIFFLQLFEPEAKPPYQAMAECH